MLGVAPLRRGREGVKEDEISSEQALESEQSVGNTSGTGFDQQSERGGVVDELRCRAGRVACLRGRHCTRYHATKGVTEVSEFSRDVSLV